MLTRWHLSLAPASWGCRAELPCIAVITGLSQGDMALWDGGAGGDTMGPLCGEMGPVGPSLQQHVSRAALHAQGLGRGR